MDGAHRAQVHDVQRLDLEIAQIVMHRGAQLLPTLRRKPGSVSAPSRTDFGYDRQARGIGMQRLRDDLVGDVRAVEIAGVDMVDAARNGLAQDGNGFCAILRGADTPLPASCMAP
jgi:hypothetical protein